jgi:uncharacterized protein
MESGSDFTLSPVPQTERAAVLDALRGFALLGILLMNIEAFVGPLNVALTGLDPELAGVDRWVDAAIYLLVQGKFYALFSLLFGVGFAVMMSRSEAAGRPFGSLYGRRLAALAAIGLAHMVLLWSGDILFTYAAIGAVLLLFFRKTAVQRLPRWGVAFYLLPSLLMFGFAALIQIASLSPEGTAEVEQELAKAGEQWQASIDAQRLAYGPEGSYLEATAQRLADFAQFLTQMPFWGAMILGMFLIGTWFWRSGMLANPTAHGARWRQLRLWGFLAGLPLVGLGLWLVPTMLPHRLDLVSATAFFVTALGNLALCLAYASTLVLAMESPRWRAAALLLAPAGRMALTNYLLQSVVCVGIFYGHGLGLYGQLSRAWQVPFVLLLFALQVIASDWWLARFRYGPMEWLWRWATYGRRPAFRAG